jgi:hypothetical protein
MDAVIMQIEWSAGYDVSDCTSGVPWRQRGSRGGGERKEAERSHGRSRKQWEEEMS